LVCPATMKASSLFAKANTYSPHQVLKHRIVFILSNTVVRIEHRVHHTWTVLRQEMMEQAYYYI